MTRSALISLFVLAIGQLATEISGMAVTEYTKVDTTIFNTGTLLDYRPRRLMMQARDNVVFSVKACSDVHVGLAVHLAEYVNVTEIVICGWSNMKSGIFDGFRGPLIALIDTPETCHCGEYRTFWVSWRFNKLEVGRGGTAGQQAFMSIPWTWQNQAELAFSTGAGHDGTWHVPENLGYHSIYYTYGKKNWYEEVWKTVSLRHHAIVFRVAACKEAWIGFGTTLGKVEYEVLLGIEENKRSCLRHVARNERVVCHDADVLSCTETRSFWITWYGGVFRVGRGEILDANQILEHDFADLRQLSYMGIATSQDVEGHWIFPESTENEFRIYNDGSSTTTEVYNAYVNVPKTTGFVFELRACQDAILALTTSPDSTSGDFAYFLHVGSQSNQQTQLFESASPTALKSVSTPSILSCDHARSFWVDWRNGQFSFGTGTVRGLYSHLSHPIPAISSVGLANKHESGAFWLVYKNAGDSMYLSLASTDMYSSWLSVRQEVYKVFRVAACDNVQLILADRKRTMGDGLMKNAYEITITNTKTVIINKETGTTLNETSRSSVLSCGEYRSFWVSWVDAVISVGQGDVYGRNVLTTTWPATKPSATGALSFATTSSSGLEMEFDSDRGDYMVPIVSSTAIDQKWMKLRSGVQWFYFKLGGGGGIIYLSKQHKSAGQGYQVYIGSTSATLYRDQTTVASTSYAAKPWQSEMLEFWVSWVGGRMEVGTGKHRNSATIFLSDPNPLVYDISSLAFATAEQQSKFRMLNEDGSEMTYDTVDYLNFSQLNLSVSHKTHTMFALQACHSAHIILSTIIHDDSYSYWIRLQDSERNGNSSIWAQLQTSDSRYWSLKSDWFSKDILSCSEERFFWLSWKDGHIVIGQGQQVGRQVIIAFQAMSTYPVRALSISTQNTRGTWRFPLSNEDFQPQSSAPTGLKSGEIAALVITCLALTALSAIFVVFLLRPPPIAKSLLNVPSQKGADKPAVSFDNPLRTSSHTPSDQAVPSYASPQF